MILKRTPVFLAFSLFASITVTACGAEEPSYPYLMQHPDYLQRLYNGCVEQVVAATLPCETIMRAQADFTDLVNQREQDPERFGARLLQEEENNIFLKKQFNAAWQAYNQVGTTQPQPKLEVIKNMRIELDKRESAYQESKERVKVLLTVIAATSNV